MGFHSPRSLRLRGAGAAQAHLPANSEAFADPRLDLIIDDCKVQLEQATEPWNEGDAMGADGRAGAVGLETRV